VSDPVLVMLPGRASRTDSVSARSIAAASLAAAIDRRVGAIYLEGTERRDPGEIDAVRVRAASTGRSLAYAVPRIIRPAIGDLRHAADARTAARGLARAPIPRVAAVVQFHRRFHREGLALAARNGIPSVVRVEALEVREEGAWGVRRPAYGSLIERLGERTILRDADLTAAVSPELDRLLGDLGVPAARRLVLSNGVDLERFAPGPPDARLLRLGLAGRFVVGWVGGFRPHHGLQQIEPLARRLREDAPDVVLCLVGTGPLEAEVAQAARRFPEQVVLAGPAAPAEVPMWLRTFDACVSFAEPGPYHYDPMKVLESLACGRPLVAARAGDLASRLRDGTDALVVSPGDPRSTAAAIVRLARDRELRTTLATGARLAAVREGSWDDRASALLDAIHDIRPRAEPRAVAGRA